MSKPFQLGVLRSVSATIVMAWLGCGGLAFAQDSGAAQYGVQPGDLLEIDVWNEEGLQKEVLVMPDGRLSFPLVGDVVAVGRPIADIRAEISERLKRFIPEHVVNVAVREARGNKIFVIGQVARPGEFVVNTQVDVMQALSMAGGTTPFASLNEILILRRGADDRETLRFNYSDVSRGRAQEQNIVLRSGDVVVVP
jgi:polysaccharide export outer membrane protein